MITESPYNDTAFNITQVPSWKTEQPEPPAPAKLSPRAKAGLGLGAAALVTAGMFTWAQYETGQADARVREQQIALDAGRLDLARQQQAAAVAQAASQETPAQKARRLAVEACVAKAGGNYGAISDCGQIYPQVGNPAMADASSTSSTNSSSGPGSDVGLIVLGSLGAVLAVGWVKKRLPVRSSQ